MGIIRVAALEDLLITAGVLGYNRPLPGRRMGLVTPSGGACDILADRAHEEGMLLPDFAPATVCGLQEILPEFSNIHNPLDVTGYIVVDRSLQQRALQVVVECTPLYQSVGVKRRRPGRASALHAGRCVRQGL